MNTKIDDKIRQLQHEIDFAETKLKTNFESISPPQIVEYLTSNIASASKIHHSFSPDPFDGLTTLFNSNKIKSTTWTDKIIFIKALLKIFT